MGRPRRDGRAPERRPPDFVRSRWALDRYGTLPLARVLDPAIRLAEDGFEVTPLLHRLMKREVRGLRGGTAASLLLEDSRRPHRVGAILRLHPLAATLRALQEEGIEEFYTGGIARAIVTDMELHGGLIEPADLAQIPWPVERRPVSGTFGFAKVRALPFPGAGSTLIQMLQLVNQMPAGLDLRSPADALMVIEIIRRGFLDRADRPFDPSFYASVEDRTRDPDYARMVARHIRRRTRRPRVEPGGETTHLSVCDSRGNAVSLTQSIERVFGSCEASPELGFLYNNYMSAFEREDISHPYYLRPNAVPWATVAPTILLRGGAPWIVIGSPGSERIGSSVLQVLMRLDHEGPEAAVAAPRFHCSLGGEVTLEECDSSDQLTELLEQSGFTVRRHERFSFHHGCVQLVLREKGRLIGVADPRRDGSAGGPSVA